MARLTRAQLQQQNRERVLAAARSEFAARGYRAARIDVIAERAELTRGAVYSNFPGKRALYFAVLAELAERQEDTPAGPPGATVQDALGAFARAWVARLPLADVDPPDRPARLGVDLAGEVLTDEQTRRPYTQLLTLDALLLGLALERLDPPGSGRRVRMAEAALTTLHGARQLAAAAPGFLDPFTVIRACEHLGGLDRDDSWMAPSLSPRVQRTEGAWAAPSAVDFVADRPADLTGDGVVVVLGLHRLSLAEHAVRAARPGERVTAALVTSNPRELAPLARLVVAEVVTGVRRTFPPAAWPDLQIVHDEDGVVAEACGLPAVSDSTEHAVRIESGRIVASAEGLGAGHAVAQWRAGVDAP
jgi:AcrR family transcriptional regulator